MTRGNTAPDKAAGDGTGTNEYGTDEAPADETTGPLPAVTEGHLELRSVSVAFGAVQALAPLHLSVARNEFVSLVGASGCGKSTLLGVAAGLLAPTTGGVWLDGAAVDGPGRDRGMVFQRYTLLPWLTALGNVEFALRDEPGLGRAGRRGRARELLARVGLEQHEGSYPDELSGGMQQRVAIARALSYRPRVLLMDEPFGALDALTRRTMQELLAEVWEEHRLTVLFVTHDIEEAVYLSDRVLVMGSSPGRIRHELAVPLPRPRTRETVRTERYRALCGEVYDLIAPREP